MAKHKNVFFLVFIACFIFNQLKAKIHDAQPGINISDSENYVIAKQIDSLNALSEKSLIESSSQSINYAREALKLAVVHGSYNQIAMAYLNFANALRLKGLYKQAIDSLYQTIPFLANVNNKKLVISILNVIGLCHHDLGHDTLTIEKYIQTLTGNYKATSGIASLLDQIANLYYQGEIYSKASSFYLKALKFNQINGDSLKMAGNYFHLGLIEQHYNNNDKALKYFELAKKCLTSSVNDEQLMCRIVCQMGCVYYQTGDFDQAKQNFNWLKNQKVCASIPDIYARALLMNLLIDCSNKYCLVYEKRLTDIKKYTLQNGLSEFYTEICIEEGKLFFMQHQLQKAHDYYLAGYYSAIKNKQPKFEKLCLSNLIAVAEQQGAWQQSLKYAKAYIGLMDSIFVSEYNIWSVKENFYNFQTSQNLIEMLNTENKWQRLVAEKTLARNRLLLFAILLLVALILLIWRLYYLRLRHNRLLKIKNQKIIFRNKKLQQINDELNQINAQLSKSEDNLRKANETKNRLFSIIAHDLKNPLVNLKNYTYLLKDLVSESEKSEYRLYFSEVDHHLNATIEMLNNLLNWAMLSQNQIIKKSQPVPINQLIDKIIGFFDPMLKSKNLSVRYQTDAELNVTGDYDMISLILRNLVSNAIKYSYQNTFIVIGTKQVENGWELWVSDSGTGLNDKEINDIISRSVQVSKPGTNNEKGTGIGLSLIIDFAAMMGGTLQIFSSPGKGSTFLINFKNNILNGDARQ